MRRPEDCLVFFRIRWRLFFLFLGLGGTAFRLGSGAGGLRTILGHMAHFTTEHTKVILETALAFLRREFTVFAEFIGKGSGVAGGRGGFSGFVLGVFLIRIVASGGRSLLIGLLIGFAGVGLALIVAGFLPGSFPVTGVDRMGKDLHSVESGGFTLLAHNVLNAFRQSGVITVTEDTFIPAGLDRETVEFDIVLDNMLVILHTEVIDSVFGVSGRINGAELGAEGTDEGGPIIHPIRGFIGLKNGRFKILQGGASEWWCTIPVCVTTGSQVRHPCDTITNLKHVNYDPQHSLTDGLIV